MMVGMLRRLLRPKAVGNASVAESTASSGRVDAASEVCADQSAKNWADEFLVALRRYAASQAGSAALTFPTIDAYCGQIDVALYELAKETTEEILQVVDGADFNPLCRRSPSLHGFDWTGYLRLSVIRQVYAFSELRRRGLHRGQLIDIGSYFGNFALMARRLGYDVIAVDSYHAYGSAFANLVPFLVSNGVEVGDTADTGTDLSGIAESSVDGVLCMGVVEHIPHTPRILFDAVGRILRPGGCLVIDTPNLHYIYKQIAMARGLPLLSPIQQQYFTEIPYEGHHREYGRAEVEWMFDQAGYVDVAVRMFCYSILAQSSLSGDDLAAWQVMVANPNLREIMLVSGLKPVRDGR